MNSISRLRLKAMSPVDAETVCKESLLRLIVEIHDCKASGKTNCVELARDSATEYFETAIRMDSDAFSSSKCKELSSIAAMDLTF